MLHFFTEKTNNSKRHNLVKLMLLCIMFLMSFSNTKTLAADIDRCTKFGGDIECEEIAPIFSEWSFGFCGSPRGFISNGTLCEAKGGLWTGAICIGDAPVTPENVDDVVLRYYSLSGINCAVDTSGSFGPITQTPPSCTGYSQGSQDYPSVVVDAFGQSYQRGGKFYPIDCGGGTADVGTVVTGARIKHCSSGYPYPDSAVGPVTTCVIPPPLEDECPDLLITNTATCSSQGGVIENWSCNDDPSPPVYDFQCVIPECPQAYNSALSSCQSQGGELQNWSCSENPLSFSSNCELPTEDIDKEKGPDCDSEGNPCSPGSGNKFESFTDYKSADGHLSLKRNYNSLNPKDGIFGMGWTSNYLQRLDVTETTIKVVQKTGRVETWNIINGTSFELESTDPDSRIVLKKVSGQFKLTNTDNSVETYSEDGYLITSREKSGLTTQFEYGSNGSLSKVTGPFGRILTYQYNVSGRVSFVVTPDGQIGYLYDSSGNLIQVTYPDNSIEKYHYENSSFPHSLTGITDENNTRFATWAYSVDGKVISSEHAGAVEKVTFSYSINTNDEITQTTVTGALGDTRTYQFDKLNGVNKVVSISGDQCTDCGNGFMKTRTYDSNGFLNGYTDWQGNQTTITNNSRGFPTQQTDAVGTPEERTTTTTWHSSLNLPLTITEPNRQTTFTYTPMGQLLTRTMTDPATGISRTTTYTYHPLGTNGGGLIATVDGPRTDVNDVTRYDYNSSDDLISITNALGHVTEITSHDPSGRPLTINDANGTATTLTWDLRGRLTQSIFDNRATNYSYDSVGQLTRVTQADGSYLDYKHDDAHRLYEISDNLGHKIQYTLDKIGNRTQTITTDTNGNIALSQTAVFDKLSRLIQTLGNNGQSQTLNYDNNHNPLSSTDAQSRQSQSIYDALNRLIKSIDSNAKGTDLEYDDQDNLTKVTDARGLETTYVYNGFDEVVSQISPDTGTTTYTYDSAGNVSSMTDARGITVNYTYDALNRVLTESYPDSTELVRYRYDNGNRRKGRIYDMRDDSGRTIFSYDKRGNNTYRRNDIDGYQFITRYSYWNDNRLRVLTYPSGRQILYTRDASGRVNRVRTRDKIDGSYTPWAYLANSITHQPFGDIKSMLFGNGLTYNADFDLDARLTQQTVNSVLENNYSYNNIDNIVTIGHALNTALNQYYEYDDLDRLIYEEGINGPRYFEYDAVGNRTYELKNSITSIYTSQKANANQIDTLNTQANYAYDPIGNILTDRNGVRTMTYNDKGRLETLAYSGVQRASYEYNAQGQRIKKARTLTDGRILNYYFQYDKQGQLLSEVYYLGTRLISYTDFVWLEGRPIAQIRKLFKSNGDINKIETRYLHTDHLYTPRKATDENGTIVWRWDSDAFGYAQPSRDPDGDGKKQYIRLRFAGQYHDPESGLFYNYFRYYDPYTGRYVTSDPIGLGGGINTYGYVGGKPTKYVDPTGEIAIAWPAIGGGVAIGACYISGACESWSDAVNHGINNWSDPFKQSSVVSPFPNTPWMFNESDDSGESCDVSIDDLVKDLDPAKDKRGRPKKGQYNNPEGDPYSDLENLPGELKNGQKLLPDGSSAGIHDSTTTKRPTLHINRPPGKQDIKIRY